MVRCKPCQAELKRQRTKIINTSVISRYQRLQVEARRRGIPFRLTLSEYTALVERPCIYCDGPLDRYGGGLDRLDTQTGYQMGNVAPSCGVCNHVRRNIFSHDEMRRVGDVIRSIRSERTAAGGLPLLRDYRPGAGMFVRDLAN
jgi:hypothetical protein